MGSENDLMEVKLEAAMMRGVQELACASPRLSDLSDAGLLKQVVSDTRAAIATHGYPPATSAHIGGASFGWKNTWDLFGEQRAPAQPEKLLRARAASARRHVDVMREELLRVQEQMVTLQRDIEAEEKDAAIWEAAAEALEEREY